MGDVAPRISPKAAFAHSFMLDLPRRRDHQAVWPIAFGDEVEEVLLLEGLHRLGAAAYRKAQRMLGPILQVEEVVDVIVRGILALQDLLHDDGALAFDLFGIEARVHQNIGQDVLGERQVLGEDLGVVAGALLTGEGVEVTADAFELLGDLHRGTAFGAFEEEMLEVVRDPGLLARLVARAVLYPNADTDRLDVRHGLGDHADAVVESRTMDHGRRSLIGNPLSPQRFRAGRCPQPKPGTRLLRSP
jgi:hypothetical protein